MNHVLTWEWADGRLELIKVECPADSGGECDCKEVEPLDPPECYETHADDEPECEACIEYEESDAGRGLTYTGLCWAKQNLDEFVQDPGWDEVLHGSLRMRAAVRIDGPGPECNDPIEVHVIAQKPSV